MKYQARGRRTHPFVRWSRYLLLSFGILTLTYCGYVLLDTRLYQADQARRFQQALEDSRLPLDGRDRSDPLTPISAPAKAEPATVLTGRILGDGIALGRIEINRLGLTAMILGGTDERTLQRAVGHIEGTPLPGRMGNVALAGHRDTFFRELRDIRIDDEIELITVDGSFRYRVSFTKVVSPEDISVLAGSDDPMLTLVTCYPFHLVGPAPERFIVRAHRIGE